MSPNRSNLQFLVKKVKHAAVRVELACSPTDRKGDQLPKENCVLQHH